MTTKPWFSLVALPAMVALLVNCGGKSAPATPAGKEAQASGPNQLSSVEVKEDGGKINVVITGSQPMSPTIFKLTDPERIIIDLTNTQLGSVKGPVDVNAGGLGQITADQFDDGASSLSRVVVGLTQPLEYEVESDRNKLLVKINKGAGTASVPSSTLPEAPAIAAVPVAETTPTAEVTPIASPAEPPAAAPVEAAPVEAAAPVGPPPETPATELTDVQYSSGTTGTTVTLVANGTIHDFQDFVLKNPNRLVVDFGKLKNAYSGGKTVSLNTGEIKQLRIGKSSGKLRVVMDVMSGDKPQYTIDKAGNSLVISLAAVVAPAVEAPVAEAAQAPAVEPAAVSPAEPLPSAAPEIAASPVSMKRTSTVLVTGLTFKQLKDANKSRFTISLSGSVTDFGQQEDSAGRLVVVVPRAKLAKKILSRVIDTREFQTAVVRITPKVNVKAKSVQFAIEMDQKMPYNVTQEGNDIVVDVEIPAQIARKQTSTMTKTAVAAPAPPADEAAATAETPPPAEETTSQPASEFRQDLAADGAKPAPQAAQPKHYQYVTKEFMSEALSTGEPLSEMGAILAGDYRGKKFTGRRISLDFKDADIRSIFRLLADISKLNLIISDDVGGRVTVRLENVPWDQAFAIILQTKSLWFEKYGNIIRIAPVDKLRAERELAAAASKAAQAAKPLDVRFLPVSYATAADMQKQVRSVLTDRGSVDVDSRTNTLIVKDIREQLEKAEWLVGKLDTQTPQVTIESRIVEASTNYTRSFGVIWGGQSNFSSKTGNPTGVFFPNSIGAQGVGLGNSFSGLPVALNYPSVLGTNAAVGMRFGSINGVLDLDLALGLLETQGHAKLISSPKVTVLDNKTANIQAGSKIPFLTQTANAGSNVRFESATTSLDVTPHITNDGSISMRITASRNEPNFSQLVQGNPLVDQRTASTEVLVRSGNTTVLGGIYSIRTGSTKDSLPGISSIPIIGWLFRNYNKELKRTELLIFVTPRIVGDERESVKDVRG